MALRSSLGDTDFVHVSDEMPTLDVSDEDTPLQPKGPSPPDQGRGDVTLSMSCDYECHSIGLRSALCQRAATRPDPVSKDFRQFLAQLSEKNQFGASFYPLSGPFYP